MRLNKPVSLYDEAMNPRPITQRRTDTYFGSGQQATGSAPKRVELGRKKCIKAYRPQVNLMSIERSCGVNSRKACQKSLMCGCSFLHPEYSAIAWGLKTSKRGSRCQRFHTPY